MDIQDTKEQRQAFELVVANKLQNSLYHSVFFNEATGRYDCADDAPAGVQVFCCDLNSDFRIWKAAKAQAVPECTWMGAYDCSVFESSCGHTFELSNDGTLDDNNMKHCCFCGGKIEAQEPAND